LLPPLFWIIVKVLNNEIDDSDQKSSILATTSVLMFDLNKNFRQQFAMSITQVVNSMLEGNASLTARWASRFVDHCQSAEDFRASVLDFLGTNFVAASNNHRN
jgi:hypothetical protein